MNDGTYTTIYDLLYSVTLVNEAKIADSVLEMLESSNILDVDEKKILTTFKSLQRDVEAIPSHGTLVSREPGFSTARTINESSLEDLTKIFINNKKKMNISSVLTNASMDLMKPEANYESINDRIQEALAVFMPTNEDEKLDLSSDELAEKLLEDKDDEVGTRFGIDCIDQIVPGVIPKSIFVIAGYTGSLKTTLALNLAYNAIVEGKNVLYLSLEVDKYDVLLNMITRHTMSSGQSPTTRDKIKKMRKTDKEKVRELINSFNSLPGRLEVYDEGDIKSYSALVFNQIINKEEKKFIEKTGRGIDILFVDHMQLLKFIEGKASSDPYQVVNYFTSFFRQKAAKSENMAVVLVSQTSRGGYEYACKHQGQYMLTGLAEANELERGATCVITLFSDDGLVASGEVQVQVLKNRYGERMLEPQTTPVRPEYYMVGNGLDSTPQQVGAVFEEDGSFNNIAFNDGVDTTLNLDEMLGGL